MERVDCGRHGGARQRGRRQEGAGVMRVLALIVSICLGIGPAMAADDEPVSRPPPRHHLAPPRAVRDLRVAAIQAPPPKPRPLPTSPMSPAMTAAAAQQNPATVLQKFTLDDLQAALADAQAQNPPDTIAANCYQALVTVVQSPATNPPPSGPG